MTLAEGLRSRGHDCEFFVGESMGGVPEAIAERFNLSPSEASTLPTCASVGIDAPRPFDWLVIDVGRFKSKWESQIRAAASRILIMDDLADQPHACDILLNQQACDTLNDYADLVGAQTLLLVGSKFVLLLPRFAELREMNASCRDEHRAQTVYVSMGATDSRGRLVGVLKAIDGLDANHALHVRVVVSSVAKGLGEISAVAARMRCECRVYVDENEIADLMATSDFAISAGGMTSYELACLGTPTLIIPATQAEADVADWLARCSNVVVLHDRCEDFEDRVRTELEVLMEKREQGFGRHDANEVLDGKGLERVIHALEVYDQERSWVFD